MKDLKTLIEESILDNAISEASLLDIDGTMEEGDQFENVDLTSIYNSKSKGEFEAKLKVFRSMIEDKNTQVIDIKPRKTYIVFQEIFPKNMIQIYVIYQFLLEQLKIFIKLCGFTNLRLEIPECL